MFLLFNVLLKNFADESYCREQMRLIFGVNMKHLVYLYIETAYDGDFSFSCIGGF